VYNYCVRAGGFVRIIGGIAKGRILKSPKGMLTRPTLDRTRESLFNILENNGFDGVQVLDIFAGTGALGLEALSRGAVHCVFIDHHTHRLIAENAKICGFSGMYEVLPLEMNRALSRLQGQKFQYIFSDPPYDKNLVNATICNLGIYQLLAPNGYIIMEHSGREDIMYHPLFKVVREKTYGSDTRISFIRAAQEGV
jgi:16S rRNA (guanine966-N2)-methyltransferase